MRGFFGTAGLSSAFWSAAAPTLMARPPGFSDATHAALASSCLVALVPLSSASPSVTAPAASPVVTQLTPYPLAFSLQLYCRHIFNAEKDHVALHSNGRRALALHQLTTTHLVLAGGGDDARVDIERRRTTRRRSRSARRNHFTRSRHRRAASSRRYDANNLSPSTRHLPSRRQRVEAVPNHHHPLLDLLPSSLVFLTTSCSCSALYRRRCTPSYHFL